MEFVCPAVKGGGVETGNEVFCEATPLQLLQPKIKPLFTPQILNKV